MKIGKAAEKLCSNSVAVLECSSKAIPLHRKKHVPTGRAVGEGISIQKENEGVKGRSAGGSAKKDSHSCGYLPVALRYFFPALLSGLSFRFFGENNPLKQTVVAKVRACVALHNPAPGIVAPL
ncbi:hypothetical protein NXW03_08710 [Bacteroides fragilis]|nr:hypothetical protein NXW03_08710 [Bacteroides fragilis]